MLGDCPRWSEWTHHPCTCRLENGQRKAYKKQTRKCLPSYRKTECLNGVPVMLLPCDKKCSCPDGWTMIYEKCYQMSKDKLPFDNAVDKCKSFGGKLFEPMDAEQNHNVNKLLSSHTGGNTDLYYWIGIQEDTETEV